MTRRITERRLLPAALALSAALLAACGIFKPDPTFDTPKAAPVAPPPPKPVTLISGSGGSVWVSDGQTGSPIDLRADQQLVVRLHLEGTSKAEWVLADFQPGALAAPQPKHYEQDHTAAMYGQVAGNEVWRFKAAQPGQTALKFELRIPRSREGVLQTVNYAVTVR